MGGTPNRFPKYLTRDWLVELKTGTIVCLSRLLVATVTFWFAQGTCNSLPAKSIFFKDLEGIGLESAETSV